MAERRLNEQDATQKNRKKPTVERPDDDENELLDILTDPVVINALVWVSLHEVPQKSRFNRSLEKESCETCVSKDQDGSLSSKHVAWDDIELKKHNLLSSVGSRVSGNVPLDDVELYKTASKKPSSEEDIYDYLTDPIVLRAIISVMPGIDGDSEFVQKALAEALAERPKPKSSNEATPK